jgi:hypothetical protein
MPIVPEVGSLRTHHEAPIVSRIGGFTVSETLARRTPARLALIASTGSQMQLSGRTTGGRVAQDVP